jgi:surfactin synthase thioesterase subunit
MGAVVAFEVAVRLRRAGVHPSILLVSGRRGPSVIRDEEVHQLDDHRLIAAVAALGGTEPEVLAHPGLLDLVLPSLRADYRAVETYRPTPGTWRLDTPITALIGDRDPQVTLEEANAWRDRTTDRFELHVCPGGGHFYLSQYSDWTADRIAEALGR